MMTRTPSKTIWVGRIGSKRDQPLVTTDALYYGGGGAMGTPKGIMGTRPLALLWPLVPRHGGMLPLHFV